MASSPTAAGSATAVAAEMGAPAMELGRRTLSMASSGPFGSFADLGAGSVGSAEGAVDGGSSGSGVGGGGIQGRMQSFGENIDNIAWPADDAL